MSAPPESYHTLGEPSRYEPDKIKGSRFIACLAPVDNEEAAMEFVASVRAEFDDARHVCFAWSLGASGDRTRSSDDGEPSGSAGRPILLQLHGHEVTDAACCVVRYFGGVKLGVGGLMRAYGGAAGQALDRASLVRVEVRVARRCTHPYGDSGSVQGVLSAWQLEPQDATYGEDVAFTVQVGVGRVAEFEEALREATAARVRIERVAE